MPSEKKPSSVMRQIDENLKRVYRQDAEDEVPDRFRDLLQKLKAQETPSDEQADSDE